MLILSNNWICSDTNDWQVKMVYFFQKLWYEISATVSVRVERKWHILQQGKTKDKHYYLGKTMKNNSLNLAHCINDF